MVAAEEIADTNSLSENILEIITDSQSLKSDLSNDSHNNNSEVIGSKKSLQLNEPVINPQMVLPKISIIDMDHLEKKRKIKDWITLGLLLVANLINYMDRYTIAGVLNDVQDFYSINNSQAGLLQTSFIISYMLLSPIFGYIGDRYNRKVAMIVGIIFWSLLTLFSSFIPSDKFYLFLLARAMVGIGEASYSTIAPTIIADLFTKKERTKALSIFYFAIPVGSGLGYIIGAQVASLAGAWQWSLRVTPGLGISCAILMMFLLKEPARGAADGGEHLKGTSFKEDIKYLSKHRSFLMSTFGFTCVAFVTGALALWAPLYMYRSIKLEYPEITMDMTSLKFGVVTCLAGLSGVTIGYLLSSKLRTKYPNADALICAGGLLSASPFLFAALLLSRSNVVITWIFIFLAETLLSLNWALVNDILLYTIIPTRRSAAEAIQILVCHMFGDAGSPYLIGVLYDALSESAERSDDVAMYLSLQYSLYVTCFVSIIGSGFFFACSLFIVRDRNEMEMWLKGSPLFNNNHSGATLIAVTANNSNQDIPDPRALITKERSEVTKPHENGAATTNDEVTFL